MQAALRRHFAVRTLRADECISPEWHRNQGNGAGVRAAVVMLCTRAAEEGGEASGTGALLAAAVGPQPSATAATAEAAATAAPTGTAAPAASAALAELAAAEGGEAVPVPRDSGGRGHAAAERCQVAADAGADSASTVSDAKRGRFS